jgi:hypothetical protein
MAAATTLAYEISFGPFSLVPSERRLTNDGVPVELGSRALDILIALVSRPNEVITKSVLKLCRSCSQFLELGDIPARRRDGRVETSGRRRKAAGLSDVFG